ncbi:hypothetical protein Ddye_002644 [Dipteronia dyeriana]|uniref:Uncharacterized protein n=1 Tax=Dipteronia dyeriana TaxID=168575 RepID=A0AAD9XRJ7_9ROSI|nr:hypothetical protein Ddye_002644 [Dipteronia dyeriana]
MSVKVYNKSPLFSAHYKTSRRETFTIWMKSLVCHTNGCTVFDSNGQIVYRVENYDKKCSNEVFVMDLRGQVLFTIRRKKTLVFGRWDVYGWSSCNCNIKKEKPWFQVKRYCRIFSGDIGCQLTVGQNKYWIERSSSPYIGAFRIVNIYGGIIAEVSLNGYGF